MLHFRSAASAAAQSLAYAVSPSAAQTVAPEQRVPTADPTVDQICDVLPGTITPVCSRQIDKTTGIVTALPSFLQGVAVLPSDPRLLLNVKSFGAIGDGQHHPLSSTYATLAAAQARFPHATSLTEEQDVAGTIEAVQAACTSNPSKFSGTSILLPNGAYLYNATILVPCDLIYVKGQQSNAVIISRTGDYGPTFLFSKASGLLYKVGISDLDFYDPGQMTGVNSIAHVVFDGVLTADATRLHNSEGYSLLALRGVGDFHGDRLSFYTNQGSPATNGVNRYAVTIGATTNPNIVTKLSQDVHVSHLEIKGGASPNFYVYAGAQLTAVDGFWCAICHTQGGSVADVEVTAPAPGNSAGTYVGNLHFTDPMLDLSGGDGLLFDGPGIVTRVNYDGAISGNGNGLSAATSHGVRITGAGGVSILEMRATIDGYLGKAFWSDAPYLQSATLDLTTLNNGDGITIAAATDLGLKARIGGGTVRTESSGINLGSVYVGSVDATVHGTGGDGIATGSGTQHVKIGGVYTLNAGYAAALAGYDNVFTANDASNNTMGVLRPNLTCNFCITTGNVGQ